MDSRDKIENDLLRYIKRFEERLQYLNSKSKKLSVYRLTVFFISLVLFFYFFFTGSSIPMYSTIAVFIILFGVLTGIHNSIERGIKRNVLWTRIKKLHIARMNLRWDELPPSLFNPDEKHPFDFDLSITGEYSLHRLMNTAASFEGSSLLKEWLTSYEASYDVVMKRQAVVKEMVKGNRFRDKLSLFSMLVSKKELRGTLLLEWIKKESEYISIKKVFIILLLLSVINLSLFILFLMNILPAYFLYTLLIYLAVIWFNGKYVSGIFEELLVIEDEFGKFTVIFDFLERYPYRKDSRLYDIVSVFIKRKASDDFKSVKRVASAISITRNPLAALVLNAFFPYNFYFTLKLERTRRSIAENLPVWLNTWYNLEALNSLANYAYLNPQCTFPEITGGKESYLETNRIAHPLINYKNNIANDFRINKKGEVFIITGSNMSGKSTFLKTIGVNIVMAYAGGSVNADKLVLSIFRLNCCIKVSDSVIDGISYFYAEVKRLKSILLELNKHGVPSVLFLIDEIFKGTNNIERLQGSRSYIKGAVKLNGTGLVSTHDLELSRLEEEIGTVKNLHFREDVVEGRMVFDYKLHPGPSPTTNALKIMKNEGLPVD
jgi:ABC-type multidrug transport system fused ATPase/permease subunit